MLLNTLLSTNAVAARKGTAKAGAHSTPFNPEAASQMHGLDEEISCTLIHLPFLDTK